MQFWIHVTKLCLSIKMNQGCKLAEQTAVCILTAKCEVSPPPPKKMCLYFYETVTELDALTFRQYFPWGMLSRAGKHHVRNSPVMFCQTG